MVALLDLMSCTRNRIGITGSYAWHDENILKTSSLCFFSNGNVCEYTESWPRWTYKAYPRNKCKEITLYLYVYMIYTHFSVYLFAHNSPIKSWPTHQFHLKLFSRGAAAAFRAFGRKLPQNSTWSGQNGLLVGFEIGGLLRGDEGWMIDGFWICPKAPKLGSYINKCQAEWFLNGC